MGFFAKLLMLWNSLLPYLTAENAAKVYAAFDLAIKDWDGGDHDKAIDDLANALKEILPGPAHATLNEVIQGE
jgi:hypothetical protein